MRFELRRIRCGVILLAISTVALAAAAARTAGAADQVPRNINGYVLFALDRLNFKGRNTFGGVIIGGNVGVNNVDPHDPPMPRLTFGGPTFMPTDGTAVVADTMRVDAGSDVYDVFANRVTTSFDPAVIRNQGPTPFAAPIIAPADLPSLPPFSCDPASPIDVAVGTSLSLAPGTYGDVRINDNATLELGSGTYTFCDLSGGKHRTLLTRDDTVVQIASGLTMNDNSYSGPGCAVYLVRSDGLSLNDASVAFAQSPEFHGRVWALNGRIDLGHASQLYGHFWADEIGSDNNDVVQPCGTCGDGIVELGEECDDGNNVSGDGCSATCQKEEICDDQKDNDGDGKIDCQDSDCPPCEQFTDVCHHPCGDKIIFGRGSARDQLRVVIGFPAGTVVDPPNESFKFFLSNANGVVFQASLQPGDLQPTGKFFSFTDKTAKVGPGIRGGLYRVRVTNRSEGVRVDVLAYGDLSAATLPEMTMQAILGNDQVSDTSTWVHKSTGWAKP